MTRVIDRGERVYEVTLEPKTSLPRFLPGQFLHLALDEYDPSSNWPESRVFSITSLPSNRGLLSILYSVKGRFTSRMEQEIHLGKVVWVKLPYGDFRFDDLNRARFLWAGGTGIAAFSSLLQAIAKAGNPAPVRLIYGIRNPRLFFYEEVVCTLAGRGLCKGVDLFVEHGEVPSDLVGIETHPGPLDFSAVVKAIDGAGSADHYLAGPPGMLEMLKTRLRNRSVPQGRIFLESWG